MSFQWIFDNAESISITNRPTVGSTVSIDGTYRAVSLGNAPWRFEVRLPDGPRWEDYRVLIAQAQSLDRFTSASVQISAAGQIIWLNRYQGNAITTANVTATYTSGNTITLTAGISPSTGFRLRAGDFVQLGSTGSVYQVAADVPANTNTVTLNRPVREAAGTYAVIIGPAVTWKIKCIEFPQWNIFARNQVSWSGPFVFIEDLS